MIKTIKTIDEIVDNNEYCPLPLEIIPNKMGINLCSVAAISWKKKDDGQLVDLTIHFAPDGQKILILRKLKIEQIKNKI